MGEERNRREALTRVLILVEGDTEETFVKTILGPHLTGFNVEIGWTVNTRGLKKYRAVKRDINLMLRDRTAALVTTLLDYYGLDNSFPGKDAITGRTPLERVAFLEEQFQQDIGDQRFRAYYSLHEFEALVFSDPEAAEDELRLHARERRRLVRVRRDHPNPEDIDDDPATAPSGRLTTIYPKYGKTLHGLRILRRVGIGVVRQNCPHFNEWLNSLESCGSQE